MKKNRIFDTGIVYRGTMNQNIDLIKNYLIEFDYHRSESLGIIGCPLDAVVIMPIKGNICFTSYEGHIERIKRGVDVEVSGTIEEVIEKIKSMERKNA